MRNNAAVNAAVVTQKLKNKRAERDVLKIHIPFQNYILKLEAAMPLISEYMLVKTNKRRFI